MDLRTRLPEFIRGLLERILLPSANRQVGALSGKSERNRSPDPPARTRYDNGLPLESQVHDKSLLRRQW